MISGEMTSDGQTLASTSKEGAVKRTADAPAAKPVQTIPPVVEPPLNHNPDLFTGSPLSKLQTYLPTGTWVTYTALQEWAFSIKSETPPTSPTTNCNAHQSAALIFVVVFCTVLSVFLSFVKYFVYDTKGVQVLYPFPDFFNVADYAIDPVMGVIFPCRTKEQWYCWPLVNEKGEFVYDGKRERLRLLVFKPGVKVYVRRKIWWKRVWDSWFNHNEIHEVPQLSPLPTSQNTILPSTESRSGRREHTVEIDNLAVTVPTLQPRWKNTLMGVLGSQTYLDLHLSVWAHGLVSGLVFLTLALLSTQVCKCFYPSIPNYLPSALQTGMLSALSVTAALFVNDNAVSLGQPQPEHLRTVNTGGSEEIPEYLRSVVHMLVWVRRYDGHKDKAKQN